MTCILFRHAKDQLKAVRRTCRPRVAGFNVGGSVGCHPRDRCSDRVHPHHGAAGIRILTRSRQTLRANQILQQELETIRTYSWSSVTNSSNYGATNYLDGQILYNVSRSVAAYANSTSYGTNNMRKVTITITWTNAPGKIITKDMTTLFAQGGLNDYIY